MSELYYLLLSVGLCIILWLPYTTERILNWGLLDTVGFPDNPPSQAKWALRLKAAHYNMIENIVPFAILIFLLHAMEISNSQTMLGASMFFYGRIIHAVCHTLAIPWLRTGGYLASWIGMLIIFINLI